MSDEGNTPRFSPKIDPAVQALLDRQYKNRLIEEAMRQVVDELVEKSLSVYPNQAELLANLLEGRAQKIRADLEEKKRKERKDAPK